MLSTVTPAWEEAIQSQIEKIEALQSSEHMQKAETHVSSLPYAG
jgi:hypothetical protein